MPPPNDGIMPWGGRLRDVRHGRKVGREVDAVAPIMDTEFGPLGNKYAWLAPRLFEHFADAHAGLQGALLQAHKRKYSEPSRKAVAEQLRGIFSDEFLPYLTEQFDAVLTMVADYFMAKSAYQRIHPEEFLPEDDA